MTFEEFQGLAKDYTVVPVTRTMLADTLTPVSAYLRLRHGSTGSFLFESVEGGERFARYSFIGRNPIAMVTCRGNRTTVREGGATRETAENFFDIVAGMVSRFRQPVIPSLPRFTGGLVGFIGYDAIRFIEKVPDSTSNDIGLTDSMLGLFTTVIAFDHLKHHITIISNVVVSSSRDLRAQYDDALRDITAIEDHLNGTAGESAPFRLCSAEPSGETSGDAFHRSVLRAKQYIYDGDIFQVVLSQRFSADYTGDPFMTYRALRFVNPSPYLYYLDFEGFTVIGSSPEILVRVEGGIAEVYPIAGTRPRGSTEAEDRALEEELLADEKERAEHVMLVDLGRNDLGRVCELGSVAVDQLMTIVRYSHVMHIASRVTGAVGSGISCVDVLKATFPAGTVSGAPKIRAMEIIDELETSRRGIYAGGVGYFDFSGNMDMCIAIRTMYALGGRLYLQAGAGIVADSDPEREYRETLNKARALVEALRMASEIPG